MSNIEKTEIVGPNDCGRIARWGAVIFVLLCGLAAYGNSFSGPFIFDDVDAIQNNRQLHRLWPHFEAVTTSTTLAGRPTAAFTFAVDYRLAGLKVGVYHATNLGIHLGCALLIFGIVRRTLARWGMFAGQREWVAAFAAALWAVHPLNTEAVTYLVQRTESLAAFFYLGVIYCLVRRAEGGRRLWEGLGVLACVLGMGCKEMMVTAPVMALLFDRTFWAASFKGAMKARGGMYAGLALSWVVLGLLLAMHGRGKSVEFGGAVSAGSYALTQLGVIGHYLKLAVWPAELVLDEYGWPIVHSLGQIGIGGWVVVGLGLGTLVALWKKPVWGFAGAWLFVILSPSSSVVPIVTEVAAEHRMYLPLAGLIALLVVGIWDVARKIKTQWVAMGAGVLALLGYCGMTMGRNEDYQTAVGIWRQTVSMRPDNPRAHINLGNSLLEEATASAAGSSEALEKAREAVGEFQTALKLQPDSHPAREKLGRALVEAGELKAAEQWYSYLLSVEPGGAGEIYLMRGTVRAQLADWAGAEGDFARECALRPEDPENHYLLGVVLMQRKEWRSAEGEFGVALKLSPNYKDAVGRMRETRTMQGLAN